MNLLARDEAAAIEQHLQSALTAPVSLDLWTRAQSVLVRSDRDPCAHCDDVVDLARRVASLHPAVSAHALRHGAARRSRLRGGRRATAADGDPQRRAGGALPRPVGWRAAARLHRRHGDGGRGVRSAAGRHARGARRPDGRGGRRGAGGAVRSVLGADDADGHGLRRGVAAAAGAGDRNRGVSRCSRRRGASRSCRWCSSTAVALSVRGSRTSCWSRFGASPPGTPRR